MAHPTENALGSSTSPWRQIFRLNNHRMNDPTATIAAPTALRHSDRHCITLLGSPAPSLSHEILPALPLGPTSALLAFASASGASASAPRASTSHTLASPGSAQLLAFFAYFPATSASTSPGSALSLWYQLYLSAMYSLPLAVDH